jgi:hypothetical protein
MFFSTLSHVIPPFTCFILPNEKGFKNVFGYLYLRCSSFGESRVKYMSNVTYSTSIEEIDKRRQHETLPDKNTEKEQSIVIIKHLDRLNTQLLKEYSEGIFLSTVKGISCLATKQPSS